MSVLHQIINIFKSFINAMFKLLKIMISPFKEKKLFLINCISPSRQYRETQKQG